MGNELSKSIPRRLRDPAFLQRYFVGLGLDVGAGGDGLSKYVSLFPKLDFVSEWDLEQGDATLLQGIADASVDFVHSSHCLEHLADPVQALHNWLRVTKVGGHVVVLIPDEQLYEHGIWPSLYNSDHKHSFRLWNPPPKPEIPLPPSVYLPDLLTGWDNALIVKIERLESSYVLDAARADVDQTIGIGECAIEFVLRRVASVADLVAHGD